MPLVGRYKVIETNISVAGSAVQIAAGNPLRAALYMGASKNVLVNVSTNQAVTTSTGFVLSNTTWGIQILYREGADLVTLPWFGVGPVGAQVTVIEVIEVPVEPAE